MVCDLVRVCVFQSTPPVRGATSANTHLGLTSRFNPRPPCGERPPTPGRIQEKAGFQSTPPVRGATFANACLDFANTVSIHAPRAGSDAKSWAEEVMNEVSIHAPRAGSDYEITHKRTRSHTFQSTPPVRGATATWILFGSGRIVSIHAPRAGSDADGAQFVSNPAWCFNPRPPCGERPG